MFIPSPQTAPPAEEPQDPSVVKGAEEALGAADAALVVEGAMEGEAGILEVVDTVGTVVEGEAFAAVDDGMVLPHPLGIVQVLKIVVTFLFRYHSVSPKHYEINVCDEL